MCSSDLLSSSTAQLPPVVSLLYTKLTAYLTCATQAVTHASIENWEYMEIIRQAADPKCSAHLESSVQAIDSILTRGNDPINKALKRRLKGLFGLADLEHDDDFAALVEVSHLP